MKSPKRHPSLSKSYCSVTVFFSIVFLNLSLSSSNDVTKTSTCEYDIDLSNQKVKVVCQGSPSMVNVYADSAVLEITDDQKRAMDVQENPLSFIPGNYDSETQQPATVNRGLPDKDPQLLSSERLTLPESSYWNAQFPFGFTRNGQDQFGFKSVRGEPYGFQSDEGSPDSTQRDEDGSIPKHEGSYFHVVWNVSRKLQTVWQNLSSCAVSIRSISSQLGQVNSTLRPDTDNLRRANNSVPDLTERIIAALRNQYNFMSNILLKRSYELLKLSATTRTLVDVTADGLRLALTAHNIVMDEVSVLNEKLHKMRRKVSKEINKLEIMNRKDVTKGSCPKEMSAIGTGTYKTMQWTTGFYMVEANHRSVYIMADTDPTSQLREYYSDLDMDYSLVGKLFTLPFSCSGRSYVIYRRNFYCHRAGTNMVSKYNLHQMTSVSDLPLPGAKYDSSDTAGANNTIDLAFDELGMWAIYTTDNSSGDIVITKIDHKMMEIEGTWLTTYPKQQAENAFMICGILYATSSDKDTPTYIRYTFNTENNQTQLLNKWALAYDNSTLLRLSDSTRKTLEEKSTNSVMLSYDIRRSLLYSWRNGWLASYPIYFKDI